MEWNKCTVSVVKGIVRALILTVICVLAISMAMSFFEFSSKTLGVLWVITTCVSILLGAIYAAKKNEEKGWLVGLILGIAYYVLIMIVSSLFKGSVHFSMLDLGRLAIAMAIGLLSGMLGINI